MSGLEMNIVAYFKGIDKYNNMTVALPRADRKKLENIDAVVRGAKYRNDKEFKTPLSEYFVRLKCRDYGTAFNVRHLLPNAKLFLRVKVRGYKYQGNVGYTLTIIKGSIYDTNINR